MAMHFWLFYMYIVPHIESWRNQLKGGIKRIYGIIPKIDTIYFIREKEYRIYMEKFSFSWKEKEALLDDLDSSKGILHFNIVSFGY